MPTLGGGVVFRPKAVDGQALAGIKRLRALSNSFDASPNGANANSDQKPSAVRDLFAHLGQSHEKSPSEVHRVNQTPTSIINEHESE